MNEARKQSWRMDTTKAASIGAASVSGGRRVTALERMRNTARAVITHKTRKEPIAARISTAEETITNRVFLGGFCVRCLVASGELETRRGGESRKNALFHFKL